jgi:hypothetical protein
MKKIVILLLVLISVKGNMFSQTVSKFSLTKDGVSSVVLNFDKSLTADILYKKIKEWAAQNPNTKIRIDQVNTQVKVGLLKEKAWKITENNFDHWYDLKFTLTIDIKDAKCRVSFDTEETRQKVWFNKDGSVNKKFKETKTSFESTINDPLQKLYNHIVEKKKAAKDDW